MSADMTCVGGYDVRIQMKELMNKQRIATDDATCRQGVWLLPRG